MKANLKFWILAIAFSLSIPFAKAQSDDVCAKDVPEAVVQSLNGKYENVKVDEWEKKSNFYVADFRLNNRELEVWFTETGEWMLSKTEIRWSDIPAVVKSTFDASEYASWTKDDDVKMIEAPQQPVQYVLEVSQGEKEVQLFYTDDGANVRAKDLNQETDDLTPMTLK